LKGEVQPKRKSDEIDSHLCKAFIKMVAQKDNRAKSLLQNIKDAVQITNQEGDFYLGIALNNAVNINDVEMVKYLLQIKGTIDLEDKNGESYLRKAIDLAKKNGD